MSKKIYDKSRVLDTTWGLQVVDPDVGDPSVLKPLSEVKTALGVDTAESEIDALQASVDTADTGLLDRVTDIEDHLKIPTGTPTMPVAANETLILGATPAEDDEVTVGLITYTFVDSFTSPDVKNEVAIGASATDARDNLIAAINLSGTEGVEYSVGTDENTQVTASAVAETDNMLATNKLAGVIGNLTEIGSSFDSGSNLWTASAVVLSGGVNGTTADAGEVLYDADGLWVSKDTSTTAVSNWERITWDA